MLNPKYFLFVAAMVAFGAANAQSQPKVQALSGAVADKVVLHAKCAGIGSFNDKLQDGEFEIISSAQGGKQIQLQGLADQGIKMSGEAEFRTIMSPINASLFAAYQAHYGPLFSGITASNFTELDSYSQFTDNQGDQGMLLSVLVIKYQTQDGAAQRIIFNSIDGSQGCEEIKP
jgi:hypothetical protein